MRNDRLIHAAVKAILFGSALNLVPFQAHAEQQLWVDGVTETSGWYDANKSDQDIDYHLCWAATASNLLAWWQDKYVVPEGVPTSAEDIFSTFRENIGYGAAEDPHSAVQWWLTGVQYYPISNTEENERSIFWDSETKAHWLKQFDGYYYEDYLKENLMEDRGEMTLHNTLRDFLCVDYRPKGPMGEHGTANSENIIDLLNRGCGIGLTIQPTGLLHAVTLWGIEYDDADNITKMWLTDSDDDGLRNNDLFTVDVKTGADGSLYISDGSIYKESENVRITGMYAIDPSVSTNKWGMQLVPEPTTATLSLLALAALAARRRRK